MMSDTMTKSVSLRYSPELVDAPIINHLVRDYHLIPNIIRASISPNKEGYTLLSLTGAEEDFRKAIVYLQGLNMVVEQLADKVSWDELRCTQCGACTAVCPSGALSVQRPEMTIRFDGTKCVVCHMCIEACPVDAVKLEF